MVEKRNKTVPKELKEVTDQVTFEKSRLYALDKAVYSFINGFYSQIEAYIMLYCGALPFVWKLVSKQLSYFDSEIVKSDVSQAFIFNQNSKLINKIKKDLKINFIHRLFHYLQPNNWITMVYLLHICIRGKAWV